MSDTAMGVRERPRMLARLASSAELRQARYSRQIDAYPFGYVFAGPSRERFAAPDGKEVLNFGSNNYLGLTTHPRVMEAAQRAVAAFGTGCSGSRILNGTTSLHAALEADLAGFFGTEAAVVTTTGFAANTAALTGLVRERDWIVADRDIHASLAEGITASGAQVTRFAHNDLRSLTQRLDRVPEDADLLVVVEGVYSVDGSVARLAPLVDLVHERGGAVLVDDAHGVGVLGATGRGAGEAGGCLDRVDLLTLTFSKALASCGGAVVGPVDAVEEIRHRADSYLFMASNVPAALAAAHEALRVLREAPELPAQVRHNGDLLRQAVTAAGWPVAPGEAPIVSVTLPNVFHAVGTWRILLELGAYCNVQIPPAVPKGRAALRFSAMATHTPADIDRLHDMLVETHGVIRNLRRR
jgi:8-amino-7-oxononanoate synthase